MDLYPFLVFVHVLGAVVMFAAVGIEIVSLGGLRRSGMLADARVWLGLVTAASRLGPAAMAATVASGMGLMATAWGRQPWIVAGFGGAVGMAAVGGVFTLRRTRRLRRALAAGAGPELPEAARSVLSGRALTASLRLRIAIGSAILVLMTMKPGALGSWLVLAAASLGGVVSAFLPVARRSGLEVRIPSPE